MMFFCSKIIQVACATPADAEFMQEEIVISPGFNFYCMSPYADLKLITICM